MRDNFVEAIKQQHDDTWMEKDGLVKKIDRGGSHQEILERAKGIELTVIPIVNHLILKHRRVPRVT